MTEYEAEIECVYEYDTYMWEWRVRRTGSALWTASGIALTRWGAKRKAKSAVKKLREGKDPEKPLRPNPERYTL